MDFRTELRLSPVADPIGHASAVVSVGSCFAERMGDRLRRHRFRLLQNPFGIVFHPMPMLAPLADAMRGDLRMARDTFEQAGVWRSFHFHSQLSHHDRGLLEARIEGTLQATRNALAQADLLILTLGSAQGFWHKERGLIVANCHKQPQQDFERRVSRVAELRQAMDAFLGELFAFNPRVRVLLTVSPVRHLRGGLVENAAGKAALRSLCHELVEDEPRVHYFPAYELQQDDLRDYRFYDRDMAHPSAVAEDYIWQKFAETWISPGARRTMEELEAILRDLAHRPMRPEGDAHLAFLHQLRDRIDRLRGVVDLELELRAVDEQLGLR
jgi:hypothetical protein